MSSNNRVDINSKWLLGLEVDKSQSCIQVGEDKRFAINRVEKFRLSIVAQQQRISEVLHLLAHCAI